MNFTLNIVEVELSRRSKKISRLQKDNRFLKYVVERAKKEIGLLQKKLTQQQ